VDGGNGRVYLIVVSATDSGGAVGFGAVTVVVPKSGSQNNQGAPPAGYFVIGDGPIIGSKQ